MATLSPGMAAAEHTLRPARSIDELKALALSADLAGFEFALAEIQTLLYTVQELRHAADNGEGTADDAITQTNTKLELAAQDHDKLKERVEALSPQDGPEADFFRDKLQSLTMEFEKVESDVQRLKDEFTEDKWLVVFRTVSVQATDMMDSLDKIVGACQVFVDEVNTHPSFAFNFTQKSHFVTPPRRKLENSAQDMQTLLSQFITLHRTLHAKRKYYDPSTARVLSILDKGISERSTINGEVLRRYSDMKARYSTLRDALDKADASMQNVQTLFAENGENQQERTILSPTSENTDARARPRRGTSGGNLLTPPAPPRSTISRTVSPFRKLANRMSLGNPSVPQSTAGQNRSRDRSESVKSDSANSDVDKISANLARQVLIDQPPAIGQRRSSLKPDWPQRSSQSARVVPISSPPKATPKSPANGQSRSKSPFGSLSVAGSDTLDFKPKWNSSTKRDNGLDDPFDGLDALRRQPQQRASRGTASRPLSPHFSESQNTGRRPSSPTLSQASAMTSPAVMGSPGKFSRRPSSPTTRIPMPSAHVRKFSGNSQNGDSYPTSLLQRAMSPINGSGDNSLEVLDSPSDRVDFNENKETLKGESFRQTLFTPEPMMRAQAARVNKMNRTFLPRSTTPQSRYGRSSSRAPSGLGFYTEEPAQPYRANPYDQLDLEIAKVVNAQLVSVFVERVDAKLTKIAGQAQTQAQWTALYKFGSPSNKAIQCKLVERTIGGLPQRKVLCRIGGDFKDLAILLLDLQVL